MICIGLMGSKLFKFGENYWFPLYIYHVMYVVSSPLYIFFQSRNRTTGCKGKWEKRRVQAGLSKFEEGFMYGLCESAG